MGWSLRVLRHRAAAQRTLLATVVAVALIGASLLGTFALLLFTSEHRALDTALTRAPATATTVARRVRWAAARWRSTRRLQPIRPPRPGAQQERDVTARSGDRKGVATTCGSDPAVVIEPIRTGATHPAPRGIFQPE